MKVRLAFVSNSSSGDYILYGRNFCECCRQDASECFCFQEDKELEGESIIDAIFVSGQLEFDFVTDELSEFYK
jgi:hypothetical protein